MVYQHKAVIRHRFYYMFLSSIEYQHIILLQITLHKEINPMPDLSLYGLNPLDGSQDHTLFTGRLTHCPGSTVELNTG